MPLLSACGILRKLRGHLIQSYVHLHGPWPLESCARGCACFSSPFQSLHPICLGLGRSSETLRRVLKADLHLASFNSSCWSAQVSNAFNGLQSSAMFKQKMLRATQVPMQEFICDLLFRHLKVWREADFSCLRAVNKKAVTYHKWCGSSESGPRGSPFSIPSYLYKDLDKHVLRNFSRFRLLAHHLRVESCKWHGGSSICDK